MLPQEWFKFVNQEVKVSTQDKQQHEGFVFTVDPVSARYAHLHAGSRGNKVHPEIY